MAGDLSPLAIDSAGDGRREAPPALVVAMAVGLGSVDTPVPSVAEWEWLNWKFPRAIRAGDTIYAHWMLTQKRPPVGGAPSSIVVWRVDVHTADGALCAEGEVGAKVRRKMAATRERAPEQPAAAQASSGPRRRRRRSRSSNGAAPEPPAVVAPRATPAKPERTAGPSRRRRRRRSPGSGAREENHEPQAAHAPETAAPPAAAAMPAPPARTSRTRGLGTVLRRLRGTT